MRVPREGMTLESLNSASPKGKKYMLKSKFWVELRSSNTTVSSLHQT